MGEIMEIEQLKRYMKKEILMATRKGYKYFGIIEAIENDTIVIRTNKGEVLLTNDEITVVMEQKVRW
jgi:protein associated with RNAse G/E